MMTVELVEKFTELESHIAREKGPFALFALFMRQDAPDRWDLIVAAPWAVDRHSVVDYFVSQIKSRLGDRWLISLSRIIVVDPQQAGVQAFNRAIRVEHGRVELRETNIFGQDVKHAYIVTSQRPQTPAASAR